MNDSPKVMNCSSKNSYQALVRVPNAKRQLAVPTAAGQLVGVKVRFSATDYGTAINPDVDNLPTTEASGEIGLLYHELSQALHVSRLLPLGDGASFFAIWFLPGQFDMESIEYTVATGTRQ